MPVRLMLPERGRRVPLPRWEVTDDDGRVLGWVRTVLMPGCRSTFYEARVVHDKGREVSLEMSTDRNERIAVIRDFAAHPERYARHVH